MTATIKLEPVAAHDVDATWHAAEPWVRSACEEGGLSSTVADWHARCRSRDSQLWLLKDGERVVGCGITEIIETPKGLTCGIPILSAEDFAVLEPLFETVESWARAEGCTRLEGFGRPGWVRALKAVGWRPIATAIAKEL